MVGKVSVLIPTFNRARYIGECIDSVLGQTLPPHQVIVIDDGSNDGTSAVLQLYGARITVLRKSNGGKSSALNLGMKHVTGDFVWIFDDDDVALPNSIELRLETLRGRPELGFIFSAHYYGRNAADGNIQRGARYNMRARPEPDIFGELMSGFFFTLNSLLARTECYRAVGDFDETLLRSQDYDMMIRLARRFACAGLNEPTYILRRHTGERGPGQLRHSGLSRESIWVKYDQQIGRRIR